MRIYAEVIALDNFVIDYIILYLCGMAERRKLRVLRGIFASLLGVAIAFISLLNLNDWVMLGLKIFCSFGIVFIAFGKVGFFKILRDFYLFTFAIGGSAMGILYLKEGAEFGILKSVATLPASVIFGGCFIGYIFAKRIIYIFNRKGVLQRFDYIVEMQVRGVSQLLSGFLDSGNLLVFSNDLRGICVGEYKKFAWVFKGEKPWGQVIAKTANGEDFLYVYKVDKLKIYKASEKMQWGKPQEIDLICEEKNVPFALSKCEFAGEFEVLLSPMLIK